MKFLRQKDVTEEPSSGWQWRRDAVFFGVASLVLGVDQGTKEIIRSSLGHGEFWPSEDWLVKIYHVTNSGAAFGILQGQSFFLILTTLVGLVAIVLYHRYPPFQNRITPVVVGMILGGALGNLVDRIRLGQVTDFIDFPRWPAFNVADASIVIAVVVIVVSYVLAAQKLGVKPTKNPPLDKSNGD